MTQTRWYFHPILVFVASILALITSLFLYIYWYIEVSSGLKTLMRKFDLDSRQMLASDTWIVIMVLSFLVGFILLGIFIIFFYNLKTLQLYRLQNNFINNFTHELKTPVTSLRLYLETFQKHVLPRESQLKYIDFMIQDTVRLNATITTILNLAKIESKSYQGNFTLKDLGRAVEHFLEDNANLVPNCRIQTRFPPDREFLYRIDTTLFNMLLMNLVTNAVKYNCSDQPELDIEISTRRGWILLRFRDNGIGIEKQNLKRIFKKFYQAGQTDDMSARGSGIGLYLAQSIARIHGGTLSAESDGLGAGSVFTLALPDKYE